MEEFQISTSMAKASKAQSSSESNTFNYLDNEELLIGRLIKGQMNTESEEEEELEGVARIGADTKNDVPITVDGDTAQSSSESNAFNYFDDEELLIGRLIRGQMNTESEEEEELEGVALTGTNTKNDVPITVDGDTDAEVLARRHHNRHHHLLWRASIDGVARMGADYDSNSDTRNGFPVTVDGDTNADVSAWRHHCRPRPRPRPLWCRASIGSVARTGADYGSNSDTKNDVLDGTDGDTDHDGEEMQIRSPLRHYYQRINEMEAALGDEQQRERPYGMSLSNEVNMTNCVKHMQHFFKRYNSINYDILTAYWMTAGYLGHVHSAYFERVHLGHLNLSASAFLVNRLHGNRLLEAPIQCRHQGFCVLENLGFIDLLDLDFSDGETSRACFRRYADTIFELSLDRMAYLLNIKPTPESLKKMLAYQHPEAKNLNVLLIRGCELLSPGILSHSTNLNSLTILEISSSPSLPIDIGIISELTHLECLNLSDLLIEMLPSNLFYKLRHLRWLIVRGCSKLRSFPSIEGLTRLVVLDLSHCTSLQQPIFLDIRYPQLQMLDLSYTSIVYGLRELSTPNLTHLSLRGLKLKHLLLFNKAYNLQLLDLSGCEKLLNLSPFMNVPSLKHLILSGCSSFMNFHEGLFDQMSCLLSLDLSWTKVKHLPSFICLTSLQKLSLRGLELDSLKTMASLPSQLLELDLTGIKISSSQEFELDLQSLENLRILNLSQSSVEKLPDMSKLVSLEKLLLADCQQLNVVPNLEALGNLVELDLRGLKIRSIKEFNLDFLQCLENLQILNLSHSSVEKLPDMSKLRRLRKLLLAYCQQLKVAPDLRDLRNLVELDLMGLKIRSIGEFNLDFLQSLRNLQILNLSHTSLEKLPDMSRLKKLKKLLLADCQQLKVVHDLRDLFFLETLDLSLPDDSSIDNRQLEIGTDGQWDQGLFPLPRSLRKLVLTNRSGIQKLFPNNFLDSLEFLDLRGTDVADCDSKLEAPKAAKIHIVYGIKSHQPSEVDHFDDVSIDLAALILDIKNQFNSAMITVDTDHQAFKMQLEKLHSDLRYILQNIDGIKSSRNWKSRKELLLELMDAATDLSIAQFAVDSAAFKLLNRLVVKLKLLVPPNQKDDSEALQIIEKKKKSSLVRSKNKENIVIANIAKEIPGMVSELLTSYNSLSDIQKQCLLCFSIFPYNEEDEKNTCVLKSLVIRKKILIYWWVGEGFIGPCHEESVDPEPTANQNTNLDTNESTETAAGRDEANEQVSATKGVKKSKSIEEIGKQILKVLAEKDFIEPVIRKGRGSGSYYMNPFVHSFVIERAKEERFFDIDQETCNLTPHFSHSRRACLLKPQDKFPSSCKFWARHVNSPKKLASFENVKTLFNVNDSMIDIKQEWFSKMKNLHVLRLGSWRSENTDLIEVEDQKFLDDLKRMKQLRLLSLQGFPTIMKLPDSVCQLSNLKILDLKECSYLEELPDDIGSLKSLTHLDISNCPLLNKLPKGISLLSKLEVLRGLVIDGQHVSCGLQHRNMSTLSRWWEKTKQCTIQGVFPLKKNVACTFRDLLKLEKLRELSLVVKISMFPDDEELKVLKEMKKLRKIKILWERSIHTEEKSAAIEQETLKECQPSTNDGHHTEKNKHLNNIEKLELWCFPHENAPEWLKPSELKNLEKLYIVGGDLTKLPGSDTNENPWNVKTLRLKHLHKLDIQWDALKNMFPQLMYLEKHQCDRLATFPCDWEGVWKSAS